MSLHSRWRTARMYQRQAGAPRWNLGRSGVRHRVYGILPSDNPGYCALGAVDSGLAGVNLEHLCGGSSENSGPKHSASGCVVRDGTVRRMGLESLLELLRVCKYSVTAQLELLGQKLPDPSEE